MMCYIGAFVELFVKEILITTFSTIHCPLLTLPMVNIFSKIVRGGIVKECNIDTTLFILFTVLRLWPYRP